MPTNLNPDVAALPLYQLGLAAGTDIGLRLALDALTAERIRQGQLAAAEPDSGSPVAARLAYTAAVLLDVTRVVAARFRQPPAV
jgi:hypothetical protein